MSLKNYRNELLEYLLHFLWRQWASLGVAGYGESINDRVIDPEALLLFSVSIARYDQRLFDEILDWLVLNERFINVQRLKTIMRTEAFHETDVIHAVASRVARSKSDKKWKKLAEHKVRCEEHTQTNLFYLKSGKPMPVGPDRDAGFLEYGLIRNPVKHRGMSNSFQAGGISSLQLQLRGLFGVNSRSEILLYLLLNRKGTIQEIANQNYYSWRSVQEILFEMGQSKIVAYPEAKRGRVYYIDPEPWMNMLLGTREHNIKWICWPALFRGIEIIWLKLNEPGFIQMEDIEQAAELKLLMDNVVGAKLVTAGYGQEVGQLSDVWGVEYLERCLTIIKRIVL